MNPDQVAIFNLALICSDLRAQLGYTIAENNALKQQLAALQADEESKES